MPRKSVTAWALTAGMVLTAACSVEQIKDLAAVIQPAQATGKGVVTGRVLDGATQRPIAEARVTVGPVKVQSGADGTYSAPGLAAGTLFLKVEATDYQTFFGEVVAVDGVIRFDIPLRRVAAAATATPGGPPVSAAPTPAATPSPAANGASPSAPLPSPTARPTGLDKTVGDLR
jgi:hypothetical protein